MELPAITETDRPFELFSQWFDQAMAAEDVDANAMQLATVGKGGFPSVRTVLLKAFEDGAFIFFTNSQSNKGLHLASNNKAALCFYWRNLRRQFRADGIVEMVSPERSDAYFQSRPRGSQIGAWASDQSRIMKNRSVLIKNVTKLEQRFDGRDVTRPPHWNGYALKPLMIEFWQERPSRLHERMVFTRKTLEHPWQRDWLFP